MRIEKNNFLNISIVQQKKKYIYKEQNLSEFKHKLEMEIVMLE